MKFPHMQKRKQKSNRQGKKRKIKKKPTTKTHKWAMAILIGHTQIYHDIAENT